MMSTADPGQFDKLKVNARAKKEAKLAAASPRSSAPGLGSSAGIKDDAVDERC